MDMDEVIREDMAQAVQYGENKKGQKIRKYKNQKSERKHAYNHNFAFMQFMYTCGL